MELTTAKAWAEKEFGKAALGDARRTKRLVEVAASVATQPSGTVTGTFRRTDEREGAYRLAVAAGQRAQGSSMIA